MSALTLTAGAGHSGNDLALIMDPLCLNLHYSPMGVGRNWWTPSEPQRFGANLDSLSARRSFSSPPLNRKSMFQPLRTTHQNTGYEHSPNVTPNYHPRRQWPQAFDLIQGPAPVHVPALTNIEHRLSPANSENYEHYAGCRSRCSDCGGPRKIQYGESHTKARFLPTPIDAILPNRSLDCQSLTSNDFSQLRRRVVAQALAYKTLHGHIKTPYRKFIGDGRVSCANFLGGRVIPTRPHSRFFSGERMRLELDLVAKYGSGEDDLEPHRSAHGRLREMPGLKGVYRLIGSSDEKYRRCFIPEDADVYIQRRFPRLAKNKEDGSPPLLHSTDMKDDALKCFPPMNEDNHEEIEILCKPGLGADREDVDGKVCENSDDNQEFDKSHSEINQLDVANEIDSEEQSDLSSQNDGDEIEEDIVRDEPVQSVANLNAEYSDPASYQVSKESIEHNEHDDRSIRDTLEQDEDVYENEHSNKMPETEEVGSAESFEIECENIEGYNQNNFKFEEKTFSSDNDGDPEITSNAEEIERTDEFPEAEAEYTLTLEANDTEQPQLADDNVSEDPSVNEPSECGLDRPEVTDADDQGLEQQADEDNTTSGAAKVELMKDALESKQTAVAAEAAAEQLSQECSVDMDNSCDIHSSAADGVVDDNNSQRSISPAALLDETQHTHSQKTQRRSEAETESCCSEQAVTPIASDAE